MPVDGDKKQAEPLIAKGDKIIIENFCEVDPVTRKPLAKLKQFVAASPDTLVPEKTTP